MELAALVQRIVLAGYKGRRRLVALAGPPASGKSTLATALVRALPSSCVVPMDGFHLDNMLLAPRGLLHRKGAPQTFDAAGFKHLIQRLAHEDDVVFPIFDRRLDRAIAGAGAVGPDIETVIVEGNYLLLDHPVWRDLAGHWDFSIQLSTPPETLQARLVERWLDYGYTPEDARNKAEENDIPNAKLVLQAGLRADLVVESVDGVAA